MKKYLFCLLMACLPLFATAQQAQAKSVLDKTAAAFRKAGGIEARFVLKSMAEGVALDSRQGSIRLKGEKFVWKTPEVATWFDGKTQWTYLMHSEEVNVSTPTQEELQQINPYSFLYLYRNGYSYTMGSTSSFGGKPVYEIILTAQKQQQEPARIVLRVTKEGYRPLYIAMYQRGGRAFNEILVTDYRTGQRYDDHLFAFDRKQYPNAEIIDLR